MKVRDIDRYKRTAAETILPDGRNLKPGDCSRRAGMVVSAVGTPGVGAAGSGAEGAGCDAWVVERPEAGGALGVAEGGRRGTVRKL